MYSCTWFLRKIYLIAKDYAGISIQSIMYSEETPNKLILDCNTADEASELLNNLFKQVDCDFSFVQKRSIYETVYTQHLPEIIIKGKSSDLVTSKNYPQCIFDVIKTMAKINLYI